MPSQVCEQHRLRYDPETQSGCVVCRREAAAASGAASPASGQSTNAKGGEPQSDLVRPLAIAASIWLVSGTVLFVAHRKIADAYVTDPAAEESALGFDAGSEPAFDPNAEPRSLGPQTDAVLEELAAQQADEARRAARYQPPAPAEDSGETDDGPEDPEGE